MPATASPIVAEKPPKPGRRPTDEDVLIPQEDADEVERLALAFMADFQVDDEAGRVLARRLALLAVRMERSADRERAAQADNVRKALEALEVPEGSDESTAAKLRSLTARLAMFDASPQAERARRYEAAAERGFFRALKELRQVHRKATAKAPAPKGRTKAAGPAPEPAPTAPAGAAIRPIPVPPAPKPPDPAPKPPDPSPKAPAFAPKPIPTRKDFLDELLNAPEPYGLTAFHVPIAIGKAP